MCGMVESEARKRRMRKEQSKNYVNGFLSKSCIYLSVTSFYRFVGHFSKLPFAISRWQRFKMFHLFVILYLRLKNRIDCYFKSCYVGLITKKKSTFIYLFINCGQVSSVYFVSYKEKAIWHNFSFKVHTLGNIIDVSH